MKKTIIITLCCTALMAHGATLNLSKASLNLTGVGTASATPGTALSVQAGTAGNVLVIGTFSTKASSTKAGVYGSWQLKSTSQTSTPIKRSLANKADVGIASVVHVFTGITANETIALQHSSSDTSVTVTTLGANLVAIPLKVSTGETLNYGLHQQSAAKSITSTTFVTTDIETSVALPRLTDNRLYIAASFNSQTTATTFPAIGTWQLQYRKGLTGTWTATGSEIRRSMSTASDIGAVTLYGLVEGLDQDTYYVRLVCKTDAGRNVQTLNGTLAAVALSYGNDTTVEGGHFDGFSVTGTALNLVGDTTYPGVKGSLTLASAGTIFASMNFTASATSGANQTAAYDLYTTTGPAVNQANQRFFTSDTDYGSGGSVGYFAGLAAGTHTIYGRYDNVTGPVSSSAVSLVGFATASITSDATPLATKLAVTSINGGDNPHVNTAFNVVVQAQDADGNPTPVIQDTVVTLSLGGTGTGSLSGTLTGTILAGTSSVTISGVLYSVAEHITLIASSTSGDNLTASGPTSSGIDLRAYQTAEGVIVEFTAYDVEEDGEIEIALLDDTGAEVWSGVAAVTAGPEQTVQLLVPGLEPGGSYDFKVKDEVGKVWTADNVTVGALTVSMVHEPSTGAELQFNSIPGRSYDIQWTGELGGEWQTVDTVTAGETTYVVVPYPAGEEGKGFFRVQQK
ncbi:MAG: hypothetical protein K9M45_00615 [Kiritimatiellales bacterium]|nr:hypothetical protein [Kiritimatiellales bacterium]